jgi:hypothetical protein
MSVGMFVLKCGDHATKTSNPFFFSAALLNDEKHVVNSKWRPNSRDDGYDAVPTDEIH